MIHFTPDDFPDRHTRIDAGEGGVDFAAFFPDGERVLVIPTGGWPSVYDASSGDKLRGFGDIAPVRAQISPCGRFVLTIGSDNVAKCWNANTGEQVSQFSDHRDLITAEAFSPDSTRIVTAANDGSVCVWDSSRGRCLYKLVGHEGNAVNSVAFSPDQRMIVTTSEYQRSVVVWDAASGDAIAYKAWVGESRPASAFFRPGGDTLALLVSYGPSEILGFGRVPAGELLPSILTRYDLKALEDKDPVPYLITERELDDDSGRLGAFSPDGRRLLVVGQGPRGSPVVWNVDDGTQVSALSYEEQITSIAQFSSDGKYVLTATGTHPMVIADGEKYDSQVAGIWDVETGENLFLLHGHNDRLTSANFSPDESKVLTASADGWVLVWPLEIENLALCSAAFQNRLDTIRRLLDAGADPCAQPTMVTACHCAASEGHEDAVALLLEGVASPDVVTSYGMTPLYSAAYAGHASLVRQLMAWGADPDRLAERSGLGLLHDAVHQGHLDVVDALLDGGASIDLTSPQNFTALYVAAVNAKPEIALRLIERGADVGIRAEDGGTALFGAAFNGMDAVVEALLERGADPDCQQELGHTALIAAAEKGHTNIVHRLLAAGADHALATKRQFTALHNAAGEGQREAVEALVAAGAELDPVNELGETPLILAARWGQMQIVATLLEAGANIDARGAEGMTALHFAARGGYAEIAQRLLERGADPNALSDAGFPPFKYAGSPAVREMLRVPFEPPEPETAADDPDRVPQAEPPVDPVEVLVRRSVAAYQRVGAYQQTIGKRYMDFFRSQGVDEVTDQVLGDASRLGPLRIAFGDSAPRDDELYIDAIDQCAVLTDRRYFLIDDGALLRAPVDLDNIESYEQRGLIRKREVIHLSDGERIERRVPAAPDQKVVQQLIDESKVADQRFRRALDSGAKRRLRAVREMNEFELRRVLADCPDVGAKFLAAKLLSEELAHQAMIVTWPERMPILARIVNEYRHRPMSFDKASFLAVFETLEAFEIEHVVNLYPERELAESIVTSTINLGEPTGRIVRAAFHDDAAAEAAFAANLLPHYAGIYAEAFCDTFEDRLYVANRVAREWVPHPEYDWHTREKAVGDAFARYSLTGRSIDYYFGKGNEPAVDVYLEEKAESLRQIGML